VLDDTGPTEKRKHGVGITPMQGPASRRIVIKTAIAVSSTTLSNFEPHIFTFQRASRRLKKTARNPVKHG
jgi:hypothetical protein